MTKLIWEPIIFFPLLAALIIYLLIAFHLIAVNQKLAKSLELALTFLVFLISPKLNLTVFPLTLIQPSQMTAHEVQIKYMVIALAFYAGCMILFNRRAKKDLSTM